MLQPAPPHRLWESLAQLPEQNPIPQSAVPEDVALPCPYHQRTSPCLLVAQIESKASCQVSDIET